MERSNISVSRIRLSKEGLPLPEASKCHRGWINYGRNNLFPQEIIALNGNSAVNNAILQGKVMFICGKGIRDTSEGAKNYVGQPNRSETWDELIEKIAVDYTTFGGFAFQVILNNDGVSLSLFHQDFSTVRMAVPDEEGAVNSYFIAYDWSRTTGKDKPVEIAAWRGINEAQTGKAYLFYYSDYHPGLRFYPVPSFYPAIHYVKADGALGEFYNNSIDNGFTPSVVISVPGNPGEEEKAKFQQQVEETFSGAKNACNILVIWGENEAVKPTITPFNSSTNTDLYNNIEGIIFQKIISAHRLNSPTLAGVSGSGNLSGNAAEIVNAFILYNYSVIEQLRRKILDTLNKFTGINGLGALAIEELEVVERIRAIEN
jgi:hypothetical protein